PTYPPYPWPWGWGQQYPPQPTYPWQPPPQTAYPWPWGPPRVDPKVTKCWSHLQDVEACTQEILSSFWSLNFSLGPACCKAISELDKDCFDNMFSQFNSPFFGPLLKEHCSHQTFPPPPPHP
ncbi:Prolamin_like domain-containing protein, partial [Cephalotus follicularis]